MKPIIVKTVDDVKVDMTLSEFNKLIEKVYNEGYKDGQKNAAVILNGELPLNGSPYIHWDTNPMSPPWQITCDSIMSNNFTKGNDIYTTNTFKGETKDDNA